MKRRTIPNLWMLLVFCQANALEGKVCLRGEIMSKSSTEGSDTMREINPTSMKWMWEFFDYSTNSFVGIGLILVEISYQEWK